MPSRYEMKYASEPIKPRAMPPATDAKTTYQGTRIQVLLAGAVSGLVSRTAISPLDVIKIRLQLQYHSLAEPALHPAPIKAQPRGIVGVASNIFRYEGITGFWKGNTAGCGLYMTYGAAQFLAYRSTAQAIDTLGPRGQGGRPLLPAAAKSFIAGGLAGFSATTVAQPLDILRTRFAAQGTEKVYAGLLAAVRDISRHEGLVNGWFRGWRAAVGQIIPYMGLFFALYEGFKPMTSDLPLPFSSGDAVAGVTASVLSKSAVFPLDTVRKRLQVQGPTRHRYIGGKKMPVYDRGVLKTISAIVSREGWRGLYRGLGVSLIKAAPASAVTMWTYEMAIKAIAS